MATITGHSKRVIDYPTSDGRPMAETDVHRDLMVDLIQTLQARYADDPQVYVSGNLLVFYREGDRRKHLSPDVFVVRGVQKKKRDNYLIWLEGKGPEAVIELTSKSTRHEDINHKYGLYEQVLRVPEYFLFDPYGDYLRPPLRGFRLREGNYYPIRPVAGRLASKILGLQLEADGMQLRLFDPKQGRWLPTPAERAAQIEMDKQRAEMETARERAARLEAEAEVQRLRHELDVTRQAGSRKN